MQNTRNITQHRFLTKIQETRHNTDERNIYNRQFTTDVGNTIQRIIQQHQVWQSDQPSRIT